MQQRQRLLAQTHRVNAIRQIYDSMWIGLLSSVSLILSFIFWVLSNQKVNVTDANGNQLEVQNPHRKRDVIIASVLLSIGILALIYFLMKQPSIFPPRGR